jgi:hypothetical protein
MSVAQIGKIVRGEAWAGVDDEVREEGVPVTKLDNSALMQAARESEARMAKLYGIALPGEAPSNPGIVDRLLTDVQIARDRDPGRKAEQILSDLDKETDK